MTQFCVLSMEIQHAASKYAEKVTLEGIVEFDKTYAYTRRKGKKKNKPWKRGLRTCGRGSWEKLRNKRIAKKRAPGERPFSVIKRTFNGDRTFVKTPSRVRVKEMFKFFAYDLYQMVTLERKRVSVR